MSFFIRKHTRTTLLAATAVLYLILYGRFLFGDAVYMYSDVGSDSLSSSYPIIVMLSRLFGTRTFNYYTLWDGLGADTTSTFLQYINPLKFLILLFGRDNFPIGILLVVFLTHMLTALFAFGLPHSSRSAFSGVSRKMITPRSSPPWPGLSRPTWSSGDRITATVCACSCSP